MRKWEGEIVQEHVYDCVTGGARVRLLVFPSLDVGERDVVITNEKIKSRWERTELERERDREGFFIV